MCTAEVAVDQLGVLFFNYPPVIVTVMTALFTQQWLILHQVHVLSKKWLIYCGDNISSNHKQHQAHFGHWCWKMFLAVLMNNLNLHHSVIVIFLFSLQRGMGGNKPCLIYLLRYYHWMLLHTHCCRTIQTQCSTILLRKRGRVARSFVWSCGCNVALQHEVKPNHKPCQTWFQRCSYLL